MNCAACDAPINQASELLIVVTAHVPKEPARDECVSIDATLCGFDCLQTWARLEKWRRTK